MTNKEKLDILDALSERVWEQLKEHSNVLNWIDRGSVKDLLTCLEIISILKEELPLGDEE